MKLERSDVLNALKPFRNGCSYRAIQRNDGMSLEIGCYHLTNLQIGAEKVLQELILSGENKEIKLSDIPLDEPYQEIQYAVLSMREQCACCGGTKHEKK